MPKMPPTMKAYYLSMMDSYSEETRFITPITKAIKTIKRQT
jgi:hypothetical protein